jgi:hypothetical protein
MVMTGFFSARSGRAGLAAGAGAPGAGVPGPGVVVVSAISFIQFRHNSRIVHVAVRATIPYKLTQPVGLTDAFSLAWGIVGRLFGVLGHHFGPAGDFPRPTHVYHVGAE